MLQRADAESEYKKRFIAELLKLSPDQIGNTTILENELSKRSEEEKKGVLDVHVLLENGTQLDIEMQVVYMEYWDDRSLFYLCKMFSSQLAKVRNMIGFRNVYMSVF